MSKHNSKEAFYERVRNLANIDKTSIHESQNRSLGELINYERGTDGVAYGIVRESHHYYIKKAGLKENLDVADFAYIGGLQNITEHQYKSLSSAEKSRNMILSTINESYNNKIDKSGSSKATKSMLTEDKASAEIAAAEEKVDDLDAATDAAAAPVEPEGEAEMEAGLDAMPSDDASVEPEAEVAPEGGDAPADDVDLPPIEPEADGGDAPIDVDGADAEINVDGDTDIDVEGGDNATDGEEDTEASSEEPAVEDPETEIEREIEKSLGKITNHIRKTELTDSQIKSYVNTFLSAFKDKFPDIDIEDRKEMAEKITKVVPPEDIEDLGSNVEATDSDELEEGEACSECGTFAQYAESRGYTAESIQECGEEEMTNLVSGYANAHDDGMNDGDFKAVALFITPEIIEKLKGEYGHDDFAGQVEPFSTEMNEEDKSTQIAELFGGLKNLGKAAAQGVVKGAQAVGDKVGQAATAVKQTYHAGELGSEVKKLQQAADDLQTQLASYNSRNKKAGGEGELKLGALFNKMRGDNDLSKYKTVQEEVPADHTEVQPMMEEEDVDIDNLDVSSEEGETTSGSTELSSGFDNLGASVVKPEGAETTTVEVTKDSVNVTLNETANMSESEKKLRSYVRKRLEEHAGIRKPSLNESKKSDTLKKLDMLIDKQYGLYESVAKEKANDILNQNK